MRTVFTHVRDTPNIGDRSCCPIDYYPFENATLFDLRRPEADDVLILGGSGMLQPKYRHGQQAHEKNRSLHDRLLAIILPAGGVAGASLGMPFSECSLLPQHTLELATPPFFSEPLP